MTSVKANGITIEYEDQGTGEPLLLLMGLGAQLIDWPQELVDMLVAKGFRVIRHDNRDAGLSTEFTSEPLPISQLARAALSKRKPAVEYRISDMAADSVGLLGALGLGSAHVVGASLGGMIAQQMAIDHRSTVRSLTSISSHTGSRRYVRPKASVLAKMARLKQPTRENAVELGLAAQRMISGPGFDEDEARAMGAASIARSFRPKGLSRQLGALLASPDRTVDLARVTAPTLVIHGLIDPLVRPSGGIATAMAVPGSRLLMFNDMGHDLPRTRRPEIADAIALNAARSTLVADTATTTAVGASTSAALS